MRVRLVHIVLFFISLVNFACRKEVSVETSNGLSGNFRAVIDGKAWIAADSEKSATILGGLINITGISADNQQLSITLDDTALGTYTLNQSSTSLAAFANNDSSGFFAFTTNGGSDTTQAGGTVSITAIDKVNKTITGVFSFKVFRDIDKRQKVITQGVFYKLPYVSSLPPSNGTDTMTATIDGAPWVGQSISAVALTGQIAISGSKLDGTQAVTLVMPQNITPGSYALDFTGLTYIGLYNPTPTSAFASSMGTLVILDNNASTSRIKGNFNFQAADPIGTNLPHVVAQGYFSVQYR
ncbi:MAG TPA: DUF6252 family protein [Cyclobacteriaceae bacterium]|nr:DUF6252 family protein [Cyclobacteriaceae bacterium]